MQFFKAITFNLLLAMLASCMASKITVAVTKKTKAASSPAEPAMPAQPASIALTNPLAITSFLCEGPFKLTATSAPASPINFELTNPSGGQFYLDSSCTQPIHTFSFPAAQTVLQLYYRTPQVGTLSFALSIPSLSLLTSVDIPSTFSLGDGSSGPLTLANPSTVINTSYAILDNVVSLGEKLITLDSVAGIHVGDEIFIYQAQSGTAVGDFGNYEFNHIAAINGNQITLTIGTLHSYGSNVFGGNPGTSSQVVLVPNYTSVTINAGAELAANAWDEQKNGILVFRASATVNNGGTINVSQRGFSAATNYGDNSNDIWGKIDYSAVSTRGYNGYNTDAVAASQNWGGMGSGGLNFINGQFWFDSNGFLYPTLNFKPSSSLNIDRIILGSPGGSAHQLFSTNINPGGSGGGMALIYANQITNSGTILSAGGAGINSGMSASGGGSGGSIALFSKGLLDNSIGTISAPGGSGAMYGWMSQRSGDGGDGKVYLYSESSSLLGITNPTAASAFIGLSSDSCLRGVTVGAACTAGPLYAGTFDWDGPGANPPARYMLTPGGCNNTDTPVCNGVTDTLQKSWNDGASYFKDFSTLTNVALASDNDFNNAFFQVRSADGFYDGAYKLHQAIEYCHNLKYGGYSDWYLPNKSELSFLYCLSDPSSHNILNPQNNPNCGGIGPQKKILDFAAGIYWASSETDANSAWSINFSTGEVLSQNKDTSQYIRCVRKF